MRYRNKRQRKSPIVVSLRRLERSALGSVMPLIAFSILFLAAFLGYCVDIMRNYVCVRQLQFAADAAALFLLPRAVNSDGSFSLTDAQQNMRSAISNAGGANAVGAISWNVAEDGPANETAPWSLPVSIGSNDFTVVPNPTDATEIFVQVNAARTGLDALQQYITPILFAFDPWVGSTPPPGTYQKSTYRLSEVIGQPASRVGTGAGTAALGSAISRGQIGFAAFPLVISNQEYYAVTAPTSSTPQVSIDLALPGSEAPPSTAQLVHVKGCLVNLTATGNLSGSYYGPNQGPSAISQWLSLASYFQNPTSTKAIAPAAIERGVQLGAISPADAAFTAGFTQITNFFSSINTSRYFIVPVIQNDPDFNGSANTVVGFARLQFASYTVNNAGTAAQSISLIFNVPASVVYPNTSFANDFQSIPAYNGIPMSAPQLEFQARSFDSTSNTIAPRPRGLVLAPSLSPRQIAPLI